MIDETKQAQGEKVEVRLTCTGCGYVQFVVPGAPTDWACPTCGGRVWDGEDHHVTGWVGLDETRVRELIAEALADLKIKITRSMDDKDVMHTALIERQTLALEALAARSIPIYDALDVAEAALREVG